MFKSTTLHIKVSADLAKALKHLSKERNLTVADLVRLALNACYQVDSMSLKEQEKHALEAYLGGFISIGKLAETMGFPVMKMRQWLKEHNIQQNVSYSDNDVKHA